MISSELRIISIRSGTHPSLIIDYVKFYKRENSTYSNSTTSVTQLEQSTQTKDKIWPLINEKLFKYYDSFGSGLLLKLGVRLVSLVILLCLIIIAIIYIKKKNRKNAAKKKTDYDLYADTGKEPDYEDYMHDQDNYENDYAKAHSNQKFEENDANYLEMR